MVGDPCAVGSDDERAAAVGRLHLQGALLWRVRGRVAAPVSNSGEPFFYLYSRVAACLTYLRGSSPSIPSWHPAAQARVPPRPLRYSLTVDARWVGARWVAVQPGSSLCMAKGGSDHLTVEMKRRRVPGAARRRGVGHEEGVPIAGAQTYLGARSRGSGHMMLDRVYPTWNPGVVGGGVGAAAQSETGCPEGTQVERRSRPQNHHRRGVSAPTVSLPPHAASGHASEPSSRRV